MNWPGPGLPPPQSTQKPYVGVRYYARVSCPVCHRMIARNCFGNHDRRCPGSKAAARREGIIS